MSSKYLNTLALTGAAAALVSLSACVNPANPANPAVASSAPATLTPSVAPAATAPATAKKPKFPVANPVLDAEGKPVKDVYISPYKPYNPIDTKGYSSGAVVGDPSTMKIDPKTKKPDKKTLKAFRLP